VSINFGSAIRKTNEKKIHITIDLGLHPSNLTNALRAGNIVETCWAKHQFRELIELRGVASTVPMSISVVVRKEEYPKTTCRLRLVTRLERRQNISELCLAHGVNA